MWFKKNKNGKNVYMLIDRSGSMSGEWGATLESVNSYITKLEDDVNVYVVSFDSYNRDDKDPDYRVLRECTAKTYKLLENSEVSPRGGTPLYDAAGKIISQMLQDNPERAVLVVMTDGGENASSEYTLAAVKAKLAEIETKKWPVVYLGAGFAEVAQYAGATFNINKAYTFNTTSTTRGAAMASLSAKSTEYFTSADICLDTMAYNDAERASFEETDKKV